MTDCFALLEETRRPWLDPDALKQKFLARSAAHHPDRVHGEDGQTKSLAQARHTELNAAYFCLREPRERLRHLLELERGRKPGDLQEMPGELADLFLALAALHRETDAFLARYANLTSPLLRAQSFAEAQSFSDRLTVAQQDLKPRQATLLLELQRLDHAWMRPDLEPDTRARLLGELEQICRRLGFFSRWQGQIQERLLRLML